ncbi:hypothetical protein KSS87_009710 [Heliosperma pusillum]|nr:hypothetical protein KSS87_009710 [Heliosperma pusillum]
MTPTTPAAPATTTPHTTTTFPPSREQTVAGYITVSEVVAENEELVGSMTLHFAQLVLTAVNLSQVLAEKLPELLDFPKDLVSLENSTKIQLKFLAEEMQAISKGLEKVVQELTTSGNDGLVSEAFCKILKEFLAYAEGEVRSLASLYSVVGRNADALAMYFGEDPAKCPFEQVVSTLLNFVRMFIRAHEENCKNIELEKKKSDKEAENEKLKIGHRPNDSAHHVPLVGESKLSNNSTFHS